MVKRALKELGFTIRCFMVSVNLKNDFSKKIDLKNTISILR